MALWAPGLFDPGLFASGLFSADDVPASFSFDPVPAATPSTLYVSNSATPSGFAAAITLTVTPGAEMSVNGGAYTAGPVALSPGQTLQLRTTSMASAGQAQNITVSANGTPFATWTVVTLGASGVKGNYRSWLRLGSALRVRRPVKARPRPIDIPE